MSAKISIPTLIDCFSDLPDPRIDRCKRHRLIDIVVIGLCSVICGAEGPTDGDKKDLHGDSMTRSAFYVYPLGA